MLGQLKQASPDTYRMLFTERNARWADWIAGRMQTPGVVFVAVGAGHLAGKDSAVAQMIYHDLAGWLMMPLALAVLWAELWLLSRLFLEPNPADVVPAGLGFGTAAAALPGGRGPGNRRPPAR